MPPVTADLKKSSAFPAFALNLFENAEIGFDHAIVSFKDGNKEAVMSYYKFKDGKVVYQETGATKLPK